MKNENSRNTGKSVISGYSTVGVYNSVKELQTAIAVLSEQGFNMEKVSVVGKHLDKAVLSVESEEKFHDTSLSGKKAATIWGSIMGVSTGVGLLAIPGLNGAIIVGTTAAAVFGAVQIAGISSIAGAITAALVGVGVHEKRAAEYDEFVSSGKYLLIAEGDEKEAEQAETYLKDTNYIELELDK